MNLTLGPRLELVASLVQPGSLLADIGSDHGYLPASLLLSKRISYAVAGELNEDPARRARETASAHGLRDRMQVRRGSGLTVLRPGEVDTVVIAGMGGATMVEILEASPEVLATISRLILQPNVAGRDLRKWLVEHGWMIADEGLALENDITYEIIAAEPGESLPLDGLQLEFGPVILQQKPDLLARRLAEAIKERQRILEQVTLSASPSAVQKSLRIREELAAIKALVE